MKMRFLAALALLAWVLLLSSCGKKEPDLVDRETFPKETYLEVADADVNYREKLDRSHYPTDTPIGAWIAGCSAPDRDEQFDVYTLRYGITEGDKTTFTYMIYHPHGGRRTAGVPEILAGENGYVIHLTYTEKDTAETYILSCLSVTLPTSEAPRLRLICDGEALGQLASVTEDEIR